MGPLMLLVALMTLAFSVWAFTFLILPAIGRAAFVAEISEIRDQVDDALIEGRLADDACVRDFVERADFYIANPDQISMARLLAIHEAHEAYGISPKRPQHSYARLSPAQRKMMHDLEAQETRAVAKRLVRGSTFVVPWTAMKFLLGSEQARRVPAKQQTPRPQQLAEEFQNLPDKSLRFVTA